MTTGTEPTKAAELRSRLVDIALQWQDRFGVAPQITSAISEIDAALIVGMTEEEYRSDVQTEPPLQVMISS